MVEPRVWGDMRHQGHARSLWGMASTETTETAKPMWFGGDATEAVMNGEATAGVQNARLRYETN